MNHIHKKLAERAQANALRSLQQRHFTTDFYSNDYIGFSRNAAIAQRADEILAAYPFHNGATGSRLLSGNLPISLIPNAISLIFIKLKLPCFTIPAMMPM